MSDVNLIIGGRGAPVYPNCNGQKAYTTPYPRKVAAEYARTDFTLGWPVAPGQNQYQRTSIADAELEVGDVLWVYAIPERHALNQILFRVNKIDERMTGATVKPTAQLYTAPVPAVGATPAVPESYAPLAILDDLFVATPLTALSDAWAAVELTTGGYFVPRGKTVLLGFEIVALPTDTTMNFALTTAEFGLISKVGGFDMPHFV